jgi:hypothetical protein
MVQWPAILIDTFERLNGNVNQRIAITVGHMAVYNACGDHRQLNAFDLSGGNLDGNPSPVRFSLTEFRPKISIARRNNSVFSGSQIRKSEAPISPRRRCVSLKYSRAARLI